MITIQLVGIQELAGRGHEHVRAFGYIIYDPIRKIVEVPLRVDDAVDIIVETDAEKAFPEIEVPDWAWVRVLNTGNVKTIHLREEGP